MSGRGERAHDAPGGAGTAAPVEDTAAIGVLMIVRPVVDPATGRTATVTFRYEGHDTPPSMAAIERLVGGPPALILTAPSRHRPGIALVVYGRANPRAAELPPSAVLVQPAGGRLIALGTLVIAASDGTDVLLARPLEIADVQYQKVDALPYPLLRLRPTE